MKKKTILLLLVLSLALLPAAALAQTEFSLGGFIKLDSWWGSTQAGKNLNTAIGRNNDVNNHHGKFNMTSQGSRFNFTIKGPKVFGATVTGFIEMDFDQQAENRTSSHSYTPRLRHAMFRLNWPETELLFGQYWSMFCEYYPESVQDGPFMFHGVPTARLAQVRVTQKFLGSMTVAGIIGVATDTATDGDQFDALALNSLNGQSSEGPQLQGKIAFEQDLWGKAPFYGKPRGFVAQIVAGWQRTRYRNNNAGANFGWRFGDNRYVFNPFLVRDQQYLDPWMVQGTLFIPVIPTHSANLAGTASVTAQWYIGQGLAAFGETREADNSWFQRSGPGFFTYDRVLTKAFGGYVQGQYWFNNQWFTNITWGMQSHYGIDRTPFGYATAGTAAVPVDQTKTWWELDATLWYRPITAIKFGLQYAYSRTDWLQVTGPAVTVNPGSVTKVTNNGEDHRVQFVGLYFF